MSLFLPPRERTATVQNFHMLLMLRPSSFVRTQLIATIAWLRRLICTATIEVYQSKPQQTSSLPGVCQAGALKQQAYRIENRTHLQHKTAPTLQCPTHTCTPPNQKWLVLRPNSLVRTQLIATIAWLRKLICANVSYECHSSPAS
jgi:hypothetical protein